MSFNKPGLFSLSLLICYQTLSSITEPLVEELKMKIVEVIYFLSDILTRSHFVNSRLILLGSS